MGYLKMYDIDVFMLVSISFTAGFIVRGFWKGMLKR